MKPPLKLNDYDCRGNDVLGCIDCSQTFVCVEELTAEIARLRKALEGIRGKADYSKWTKTYDRENDMDDGVVVRWNEIDIIARQALEAK